MSSLCLHCAYQTNGTDITVADAPPNPAMMKQAREWFGKALKIDPQLTVAKEFAAWVRSDVYDLELTTDRRAVRPRLGRRNGTQQ